MFSGNSYIHELTTSFGYSHLRIETKTFDDQEGYAEYSFSVDDENSQYMIHVTWISGNIGGQNCVTINFFILIDLYANIKIYKML